MQACVCHAVEKVWKGGGIVVVGSPYLCGAEQRRLFVEARSDVQSAKSGMNDTSPVRGAGLRADGDKNDVHSWRLI